MQSGFAVKPYSQCEGTIQGFGSVGCDEIDPHRRAGLTRTGPIIEPAEWTTTQDSQHPHLKRILHAIGMMPYDGARTQGKVD